jgi:hypothetical protein
MAARTLAYNVLRWIGLTGLLGPGSPVRHPGERRLMRTVMEYMVALPAQCVRHAPQLWLRFSAQCPGFVALTHVRQWLQACTSGWPGIRSATIPPPGPEPTRRRSSARSGWPEHRPYKSILDRPLRAAAMAKGGRGRPPDTRRALCRVRWCSRERPSRI